MSHCQGTPECKCHFTQQTLLAEKNKRIAEEGNLDSYPKKLKYIVHATDRWYCSDCGHAINVHVSERSHPATASYVSIRSGVFRDTALTTIQTCAITGECDPYSLQACHIVPKAVTVADARAIFACGEDMREDVKNALLLRTDFHKSFDEFRFGFEKCPPAGPNYKIRVFDPTYKLEETHVRLNHHPFEEALAWHLNQCKAKRAKIDVVGRGAGDDGRGRGARSDKHRRDEEDKRNPKERSSKHGGQQKRGRSQQRDPHAPTEEKMIFLEKENPQVEHWSMVRHLVFSNAM